VTHLDDDLHRVDTSGCRCVQAAVSSVFCEIEDAIELGVALPAFLDSAAHKLSMRL